MKARQIIESNEKLKDFLSRHSRYSKPAMMLRDLGFIQRSFPYQCWYNFISIDGSNGARVTVIDNKMLQTKQSFDLSLSVIINKDAKHLLNKLFLFRQDRVTYEEFAPWFQDFVMSLKSSTSPTEHVNALSRLEDEYEELHQQRGHEDLGFPEM